MRDVAAPTIYVCAPARACVTGQEGNEIDNALIEKSFHEIRALGWRVKESANIRKLDHGFAGSDKERAQALMDGFADPEVDVVLALRGGYGTARLLPFLDWEKIGKSEAVFAGLSDLTAFNLALYAKCGRASWQGPTARAFARCNQLYNERFMRAMTHSSFVLDSRVEGDDFDAQGLFWGGNLTMLTTLAGTPHAPTNRLAGRPHAVFLEDVNEPAWRIERSLLHLSQAGMFDGCRAVLLGDFLGADRVTARQGGYDFRTALSRFAKARPDLRIVTGLPIGHGARRETLPVGAELRLSSDGRVVTLSK